MSPGVRNSFRLCTRLGQQVAKIKEWLILEK